MEAFSRISRLAYPAGRVPGFDSTHPAAVGMSPGHGFSGVAMSGAFPDLLKPLRGSVTGTVTFGMDGAIGPTINMSDASNNYIYSGYSTIVDTRATFAAIVNTTSIVTSGTTKGIITTSSGNTGIYLSHKDSLLRAGIFPANTSIDSTIALLANTPFFIAVSIDYSVGAYFLMRNLKIGSTKIEFVTGNLVPGAPNGSYDIGGNNNTFSFNGAIAAAMFAPQACGIGALLQWADDPWSFWYPQPEENWTSGSTIWQGSSTFTASGRISGPAATFDPSFVNANVTLDVSNLIVTGVSAPANTSARSTVSVSAGKFFCEFSINNKASQSGVGVCNASQGTGTSLAASLNAIGYMADGTVKINSSTVSTLLSFTTGDIVDMAVDFDNSTIWFRKNNGAWNNSGTANPGGNVGGISLSTLNAGPYFAAVEVVGTDRITAAFHG